MSVNFPNEPIQSLTVYSESCLSRILDTTKSCINQTFTNVSLQEIYINLTCINQNTCLYPEVKSWSQGGLVQTGFIGHCIFIGFFSSSAISKKTSTNIEELAVPKLYLVTSALHSIVSSEEFDNYHQAIYYLEYLYEICKDFIPFRIYSRLITGYKMVVSFDIFMMESNIVCSIQLFNLIGGVIMGVLTSSVVDCGFKPQSNY